MFQITNPGGYIVVKKDGDHYLQIPVSQAYIDLNGGMIRFMPREVSTDNKQIWQVELSKTVDGSDVPFTDASLLTFSRSLT